MEMSPLRRGDLRSRPFNSACGHYGRSFFRAPSAQTGLVLIGGEGEQRASATGNSQLDRAPRLCMATT